MYNSKASSNLKRAHSPYQVIPPLELTLSLPLLSTKLYIPRARPDAVERLHLVEKLLAGMNRPGSLLLLSGPAGFGKTTLLSQFVSQLQHPAAWVSLDEGDNDPIRFWTYLLTACQTVQSGFGEMVLALLRPPQTLPDEVIPTILANEVSSLAVELVLVLDDYHTIQNPSIHAAIAFLLEHLPDQLHLVISSRVDPPWPVARLRARNQLVEIRAADLRFSINEAEAFLNRTMGLALSGEDVAAMEARTEGWAAGLQLAAIALQSPRTVQKDGDSKNFIRAFTGSNVFIAEYLVEEVLQRQPEELQAFLLETSILEHLNAKLCEAVTGRQNGQAILAALHRANLFVLALDDQGQWFRYHHLFADLLQARLRENLKPEAVARLHQRAAAWFEQASMPAESIEHALAAKDYLYAVQVIEKVGLPMILQAYICTVEDWLQAIPQEFLARSPRASMASAWMNLLRGNFDQAVPYIKRLTSMFSESEAHGLGASLQGEWLAIQSKLRNLQGKPAESRDLARQALQILPEADTAVRSMVLVNLATAYQQMLDYEGAAETFQMIVRDARAAGDHISETLGISGQAQMVLQQGRLHLGFELASEGIKRLEGSGRTTPFSATLFGELGQIHYHWHQLEKAQSYLQRSIQASGQSGYSDPEIYKYVMRSRILQMEGDWDNAAWEMQQASNLARRIPPAMIREEVISQQVRVELAFDRLDAAQALLKAEGFNFEGGFRYPELTTGAGEPVRPVTHPAGLLYNCALRVLLFQARKQQRLAELKRGLELAGRVLEGELLCQQIPSALETLLLRAQMQAVLGEEQNSLADIAKALELAAPEGFVSIFVEEGEPIAEALVSLLKHEQHGRVQPGIIKEILAAFPGRQPTANMPYVADDLLAPVEPLTARELEVLRLIAAGDSNQTIAEKLVITVSAVKKHTSNIFGKLGVNSRTQAAVRARQLKLLPAER